jgi:hypothetical protein
LGHQLPILIFISGFQPLSPILAPGGIPHQAEAFLCPEATFHTRRNAFPCPEAAFRQIVVHTTSLLIAQMVSWRGQSERIVRFSTGKCCREYLTDESVDNELQIKDRQAIPPKKLTSNVLPKEKKCYLRWQSSHKRRWK